jgi:hypothetical protein
MIPELVNQYAEFAIQVKNSQTLGEPVKAQIMLQMAQALSSLVPLAGGQQDQIVQQQHQMDLEKHQAEQQKAAQNHQMGLVQKEQQHQIALKQKAQQKPEVKNNGK